MPLEAGAIRAPKRGAQADRRCRHTTFSCRCPRPKGFGRAGARVNTWFRRNGPEAAGARLAGVPPPVFGSSFEPSGSRFAGSPARLVLIEACRRAHGRRSHARCRQDGRPSDLRKSSGRGPQTYGCASYREGAPAAERTELAARDRHEDQQARLPQIMDKLDKVRGIGVGGLELPSEIGARVQQMVREGLRFTAQALRHGLDPTVVSPAAKSIKRSAAEHPCRARNGRTG